MFQTIPQALNTLAETQAPPWSPAASQLFSYVEWTVKSVKPPIFGIKITVRDLYHQNFCAGELILVKIGLLEFTDLITFRCYFKNERELPQECQDSTIHVTSHSIFDEKSHFLFYWTGFKTIYCQFLIELFFARVKLIGWDCHETKRIFSTIQNQIWFLILLEKGIEQNTPFE